MIEQIAKMNEQWTKLNELEKEMIKQKRTTRKRSDQNKWAKSDLFEWAGAYRKFGPSCELRYNYFSKRGFLNLGFR